MGIKAFGNNADDFVNKFVRAVVSDSTGKDAVTAPSDGETGLTATGGVISDYTSGPKVYRTHIFTASGSFTVSEIGTLPATIDYVIVSGGGGGAANGGTIGYETGGGGAGAFIRQGISTPRPVSVQAYPVVVGGGGVGGPATPAIPRKGNPSSFYGKTAEGGGAGGYGTPGNCQGGSGGGGSFHPSGPSRTGGTGNGAPAPAPVQADGDATDSPDVGWGHPGGTATYSPNRGAGGGGAGGAGADGDPGSAHGGAGLKTAIAGPNNDGVGAPGPAAGRWFAGGGGGVVAWGSNGAPPNGEGGGYNGPYSGGGDATGPEPGRNGYTATGGGGGAGAGGGVSSNIAGNGGSGIVMVRYQIGEITATAKASGGSVSFYNNKTIHTFTNTGTFQTPGSFSETCEYVVIGGGGGAFTGGGGAGGYRTGTTPIGNSVNYTITVGAGAALNSPIGSPSSIGTIPIAIPGGGSSLSGPEGGARPGASGGGGVQGGGGSSGSGGTGSPYPGSIGATPSSGWGHAGGGGTPADSSGGGGGGATTAGYPGSGGGEGIQLPTTFRDPAGYQYDKFPDHPYRLSTSAGYFVAGGGSGTVYTPGPTPYSASRPGMGGIGGGGCRNPADPRYPVYGFNGMANTGGGGAGGTPVTPRGGSQGGSGLVLIAYPS